MTHRPSLKACAACLCLLWLGLAAGAAADVQTYSSSPNAFIPDALPPGPGTPQSVTDTILVGDSGTIDDLNVTLTVRHPQTADVAIDLTDPTGTVTVRLFNRDGGVADGLYDVTFDDEAGGPPPDFLTNGQCMVSTSFTPSGNLSDFDGLELQGLWTITVTDHAFSDASDCDCDGLDVGPSCPRTLDEWSMEIDFTPTPDNLAPVAQCQDVSVEADQTSCTAEADVDDGSFDPDGDPITLEQDPPGPYGLGDTLVTLTVTDDGGALGHGGVGFYVPARRKTTFTPSGSWVSKTVEPSSSSCIPPGTLRSRKISSSYAFSGDGTRSVRTISCSGPRYSKVSSSGRRGAPGRRPSTSSCPGPVW